MLPGNGTFLSRDVPMAHSASCNRGENLLNKLKEIFKNPTVAKVTVGFLFFNQHNKPNNERTISEHKKILRTT
ncbi:MAG: hypothetical protein JWN25_2971 [Verrucomicrobiales bacterium]|nr:hypothetical protein [Verrucomicrobiales bacterium]MDB6131593.1 hypothetical protein [Verrucomicrobiales bacterium]